ncbi:peptide ABC transporter substrate-binding protein [Acrocarpospora macrocephala]|uniref:ABC transporter substrate-binding protein n=1 Tax=Acrocarpospora macrocephala TaxID=150177 RepID=A0A5M3X4W6_9ACTN|nr:ABC transporter substrate-binding protein [Acrocarpospora macrocephala]GES15662.1 ABC transporter substrate-binding protein [Acrocarpospora macrocephala]
MRRTTALTGAFVLVGVSALAGCGGSEPGASSTPSTAITEITMLQPEPSQGLDPNIAAADASRIPMAMMYETLTERDENGKLVGALAEKWESSPDNTTYTFTLKGNAAFSDGTPVTAEDVKFSFDRMKTGEVMKGLLSTLTGVEAVDQKTVRFTLSAPSRIFPETASRPGSAAILSKKAVEAKPDYFTLPTATSGPWQLTSYVPKGSAIFDVNPHYPTPPKISKIRYTFSEDPSGHAAAIESGSGDIANIGYTDAERLKSGGSVQVLQSDALAPLFWGWDRTKPPFSDKKVRQAVAFAVDREGRQTACWSGTGGVTYGNILRPWDPNYTEISTYQTSSRADAISKAGALLDAAGWVQGAGGTRTAKGVAGVDDGTPFKVSVPYESNWPAAGCHVQVLQQNLKDVGIQVTPEKYDPAAYWGDVAKGKFAMYHGGAGASGAADLYQNWFHTGGSLTSLTTHLADESLDAKIDQALGAGTPADATAIFKELEQWQADEVPMLVVGYQWPQVAVSKRVKNFTAPLDDDSYSLVRASVG